MGLEEIIYASVEIRNFLKLFSDQHWNKVCKATLLLGIHRLTELSERVGPGVTQLTVDAIEELVVAAHKKHKKRQRKEQSFDKPARTKAKQERRRNHFESESKQVKTLDATESEVTLQTQTNQITID